MDMVKFDEGRKEKLVFFADDSSIVRKIVAKLLDQSGFRYDAFDDGSALIEFFQKYSSNVQPDVIILDVEMPNLNGFDTCRKIKAEFPEIASPILFFTATDTPDRQQAARQAGGDEFIKKPFAPDKLVERLDYWCGRKTGWDSGKISYDDSRKEKLVMLADDSSTVRKMVSFALEKAGFTVEGYENGLGMVIGLEEAKPSLIILDVEMPDMDGFETCEKIRAEFPNLQAPIIFFTSHKGKKMEQLAEDAGGNGYFTKSLPPEELVEQVELFIAVSGT